MDEEQNYSRVNKYDKRRKTTKSITILMVIAVLLVILLIGMWLFGGKENDENDKFDQSQQNAAETEENSEQSSNDSSMSNEDEDEETEEATEDDEEDMDDSESEEEESIEIEEIPEEEIDDPNVIEAYTANWKPIGTPQEEPHTTKFEEGSDDWNEMQEAIAYALEIERDEIISHWIGNGGEQRVNGYVQSTVTDEHYTVYLEWKENEGWQPIKVERVEKFIHPNQAE